MKSKPTPTGQRNSETGTRVTLKTGDEYADDVSYPLKEIELVVKHYSHDLRNTLNGMDLDLTLLSESTQDPDTRKAIKSLQAAGIEIGRQLQGLLSKYGTEAPFIIPVIQVAERWKLDANHLEGGPEIHWSIEPSNCLICGEAALIRNLLWELLRMAVRIAARKPLHISCRCQDGNATFGILIADSDAGPRRIDPHIGYWSVLMRLAERSHARILPAILAEVGEVSLQLILPTCDHTP